MRNITRKALDVCLGDEYHIVVPNTGEQYALDAGTHILTVEGPLAAKPRANQCERRFIVSEPVTLTCRVYLALCIPLHDCLDGWAFLASDKYPVQIRFVPNLEFRLAASLEALATKL